MLASGLRGTLLIHERLAGRAKDFPHSREICEVRRAFCIRARFAGRVRRTFCIHERLARCAKDFLHSQATRRMRGLPAFESDSWGDLLHSQATRGESVKGFLHSQAGRGETQGASDLRAVCGTDAFEVALLGGYHGTITCLATFL